MAREKLTSKSSDIMLNPEMRQDQKSPIQRAIESGDIGMVQLLLNHNADLNIYDYLGVKKTVLYTAIMHSNLEMVKMLMIHDPSLVHNIAEDGETVLHYAIKCGKKEIAKFLIQNNPELINIQNHYGQTALHHAAHTYSIHDGIFDSLVKSGGDLSIIDSRGNSACNYLSFDEAREIYVSLEIFIRGIHPIITKMINNEPLTDHENGMLSIVTQVREVTKDCVIGMIVSKINDLPEDGFESLKTMVLNYKMIKSLEFSEITAQETYAAKNINSLITGFKTSLLKFDLETSNAIFKDIGQLLVTSESNEQTLVSQFEILIAEEVEQDSIDTLGSVEENLPDGQ